MKQSTSLVFCMMLTVLFTMLSCSKENEGTLSNGKQAKVNIRISNTDEQGPTADEQGSAAKTVAKASMAKHEAAVQERTIPFPGGGFLTATLIEDEVISGEKGPSSNALRADVGKRAAVQPLKPNITYGILVYDANGNFVDRAEYTVGGTNPDPFYLNIGEQYKIIGYSLNNTDPLPSVNETTLAETKWEDFEGLYGSVNDLGLGIQKEDVGMPDLLYVQEEITVPAAGLNLNLVLKHVFSSVRFTLDFSERSDAPFFPIALAYAGPHYNLVDFNFADGSVDPVRLAEDDSSVSYPTAGAYMHQQAGNSAPVRNLGPVIIATGGVTNHGFLQIGHSQGSVGGYTPLRFDGLHIEPGHRYHWNIVYHKEEEPTISLIWSSGNVKYISNSTYTFAPYTDTNGGSVFGYNQRTPFDGVTHVLYGDPCAQVAPKGVWRMPTQEEWNTLFKSGYTELSTRTWTFPNARTENGQGVSFYLSGYSVKTILIGGGERYDFFPFPQSMYWIKNSSTLSAVLRGSQLVTGPGVGFLNVTANDREIRGYHVRCVRDAN